MPKEMKEYNKIEVTSTPADVTERYEEGDVVSPKRGPVLSQEAKTYKKPLLTRVRDTLFGGDGVFSYLGSELIVPAIKNIVVESVSTGINVAIFGRDGYYPPRNTSVGSVPWNTTTRRQTNYGGSRHTNYNRYAGGGSAVDARDTSVRSSNRVEEFLISDRNEALEVIHIMTTDAATYGHVSVADYYDLIGVGSAYTDNNYGWYEEDLRHTTIAPVAGGYIINLPRPVVV